jgi:hypothetical protein
VIKDRKGLEWLQVPLVCEGKIVRPALSLDDLSDADLPDICFRMNVILDAIEFNFCEGRWINLEVYDPISDMEEALRRYQPKDTFDHWHSAIARFADFYSNWLDGTTAIEVTPRALKDCKHIAEYHGIPLGDDPSGADRGKL